MTPAMNRGSSAEEIRHRRARYQVSPHQMTCSTAIATFGLLLLGQIGLTARRGGALVAPESTEGRSA